MARRTLANPATRTLLAADMVLWGAAVTVAIAEIGNERMHATLLQAASSVFIALLVGRALLSLHDHIQALGDTIDGAADDAADKLAGALGPQAQARDKMATILSRAGMKKNSRDTHEDVPAEVSELDQWRAV